MKSFITASIISLVSASGMLSGPCPTYEANMKPERLNHTMMGGLWYEYLYTSDYKENRPYDCASWNMLSHATNETHKDTRFEVLHHSLNRTTEKTEFLRQSMTCG